MYVHCDGCSNVMDALYDRCSIISEIMGHPYIEPPVFFLNISDGIGVVSHIKRLISILLTTSKGRC